VLPISYPSLSGTGLQPGRSVFVGQYLFTGAGYCALCSRAAEATERHACRRCMQVLPAARHHRKCSSQVLPAFMMMSPSASLTNPAHCSVLRT
jgi:predicted amidophosphoribosyltransferase